MFRKRPKKTFRKREEDEDEDLDHGLEIERVVQRQQMRKRSKGLPLGAKPQETLEKPKDVSLLISNFTGEQQGIEMDRQMQEFVDSRLGRAKKQPDPDPEEALFAIPEHLKTADHNLEAPVHLDQQLVDLAPIELSVEEKHKTWDVVEQVKPVKVEPQETGGYHRFDASQAKAIIPPPQLKDMPTTLGCWHCGEKGHLERNCPHLLNGMAADDVVLARLFKSRS